ncbi:hypothetical protein EDB84DRAFT_1163913 [Lactarius hengduanensis]|nr:hypothetical protein EDB84DRAFT_1163913 [Lactarius hengduanensis]
MLSSKRARRTSLTGNQSITDSEEQRGQAGLLSPQVTVGNLPDEVLLSIFRYYLDASPQCWPKLVHVCRKWRHIVFASPLGLRLRLYCTHGTPVLKNLDCWPALPIVVQCGGSPTFDPPALEDEDNIMAALKHSDRVISISLTVTSSLVEKMDTIAEPFSELEDLVLLSQNTIGAALPSTFKWASRLRSLHSTRIAFPALPELLSFSKNLVYLRLHEIPSVGYFSPEAFADALSGMTQLRSLSLHFLSLPSHRDYIGIPPPPGERIVLPVLECFKYRGTNKYLDNLVARIDAPCLEDIDITFFNQPTFNVSQLGRFLDRIEMQKLHGHASILISNYAISICFTRPGTPARLRLQISCEQLDWQLSSMGQICDHFPAFFSCIGDLRINATPPSSGQNDMDNGQWLHLIRSFRGAERFSVAGKLGTAIMRTLLPADGDPAIVLPLLRNLHVEEPGPLHAPLRAAVVSFITSRRLSGRPVAVEYTQPIISPPNFTAEDETPWERLPGGPVKLEHMQPMDPLKPTADDETTPWGSPRHVEVAPPGFIYNYAYDSDIRRAFKELTDGDNQPRLDSFGPIPFLSEHASLLNVAYGPFWAGMGI